MNAQSSIIPFIFENSTTIRTESVNGQPWFLAKDLCEALGYINPWDTIKKHVFEDDLAKREVIDSLGRKQLATWVNESGMYALIFGSKLPSAQAFKRWVTSIVLPALRNYGHYETPAASTPALPKNELSEKDLQTIRDFIYSCSQTYTWGRCFSYAAWYALRKATGVKSPDKFEYKHMQTIIKELQRLQNITDYYHFTIAKIEQTLIKKIIRKNGTPAELMEILNEMEITLSNDKELEKVRQIKGWQSERLMSLAS